MRFLSAVALLLASPAFAIAQTPVDTPYGSEPWIMQSAFPSLFPAGSENPPLIETSAGGVTVRSNLAAGGAVWEWEDNGVQYINDWDYGRQVQAAFYSEGTNPTEAGSRFTDPGLPDEARQGSPIVDLATTPSTQVTRSAALEWNGDRFGGDVTRPVRWSGVELGKELTLDYAGLGSVAKYTTVLELPVALPRAGATAALEMPTPYLRGEFDHFWTYDAGARIGPTDVTATVPCMAETGPRYVPDSGLGGAILTDGPGPDSAAFGVYAATREAGGLVDYFSLLNFLGASDGSCNPTGTGQFDFATAKISVLTESAVAGAFAAGTSRYNAWIATGTLAEVTAAMDELAARGEV